jgi:glycosyltransferase involved in cell wall biosynthesis
LLKRNLRRADRIFSTSEIMKAEVRKLGMQNVVVTPFGVDTNVYKAQELPPLFANDVKVIGTIKTLEAHYAIDVLIHAFAQLKTKYKGPLKLVICGSGTQEQSLRRLAAEQSCANDIIFKGAVAQDEVPAYMNRFDVFANLSLQESFGVAVVEAMACEVPVVVSDAPGLLEVTANGSCGLVVKRNDADAAAEAMYQLLTDAVLYEQMQEQGRRRVEKEYDWNRNLDEIEKQYAALLKRTEGRK